MIQFEFLIFLGLGLLLAVAELISVRRAIRRDREAKAGLRDRPAVATVRAGRAEGDP